MNITRTMMVIASAIVMTAATVQSAPPKEGAVFCDKCKIVMVKVPSQAGAKNQLLIYRKMKKMVCPDCKSAIENFFRTGKLKHTCSSCGGNMTVCVH